MALRGGRSALETERTTIPGHKALARALVAALTTAALAVTGVVATAPAASAEPGCYVQLKAPAKITIDRNYKAANTSLIDSCGIAEYASFDLYGSRGWDNIFIFDGTTTEIWDIYDWQDLGTFTTRGSLALDSNYDDMAFKSTTIKIKLGARAAISSKRTSKTKVKLSVEATSYSTGSEKFTGWNASSAKIQYKSGTTWKTLKTVKLKGGKASYTTTSKAKRTYRFVTAETSARFGAVSVGTTR